MSHLTWITYETTNYSLPNFHLSIVGLRLADKNHVNYSYNILFRSSICLVLVMLGIRQ